MEVRMGNLEHGKAVGKDEVTGDLIKGWWAEFRGFIIWLLREVFCRKTGDLL